MGTSASSSRTYAIEHVTIPSANAFDAVREKLEKLVPPLNAEIFAAVKAGDQERAMQALDAAPPVSIFGTRDHGTLLGAVGLRRRVIQYEIGNPFTASKMTRHRISAALYAPIRVLLRDDQGSVAFEYDRPVSVFGQFQDPEVDIVARQLDRDLRNALEAAAS